MKLKVYFENIDIKLLRKQKSFLLKLAASNEEFFSSTQQLEGIISLIDEIQDQAADVSSEESSEEEVFGNFCEACGSNNTERTNMHFDGDDDCVPVIECQEEGCWHVKKINVTN